MDNKLFESIFRESEDANEMRFDVGEHLLLLEIETNNTYNEPKVVAYVDEERVGAFSLYDFKSSEVRRNMFWNMILTKSMIDNDTPVAAIARMAERLSEIAKEVEPKLAAKANEHFGENY